MKFEFHQQESLDSLRSKDYALTMSIGTSSLTSPAVLIERQTLEKNITRMQAVCDEHGTELWPHIKTHKLVPVLRQQLAAGAKGATCAKIGEAEALLPSGVRRIFIAHSIADLNKAPRLKALQDQLDELILAVTSEAHFEVLEKILQAAGISVPVLLAVNTGLEREGARGHAQAARMAAKIRNSPVMTLKGIYTHEGQSYGATSPEEAAAMAEAAHAEMLRCADAVGEVTLWPGCSVTATFMPGKKLVQTVRPGSYVFGDLSLTESTQLLPFEDGALSILATVVDRPADGLALIDAGSKVFSGDKSAGGLYGRCLEDRSIVVNRVSEEHGFLSGEGVNALSIGQRLRFQPAHVCPVLNLADHVHVVENGEWQETWPVEGRGRSD